MMKERILMPRPIRGHQMEKILGYVQNLLDSFWKIAYIVLAN